ncbi:hypothetical protein OAP56_02680, partial [Rickettsiaceae bacterium]|nr:hypothetical protein [Rickettsiaceae bacterium]
YVQSIASTASVTRIICRGILLIRDRELLSLIKIGIKNKSPNPLLTNTTMTVGMLVSNCFAMDIETLRDKTPIIARTALFDFSKVMD